MPNESEAQTSFVRSVINATNFEIKISLIQMVQQSQFRENATEDPNNHLTNFMDLCGTIKINEVKMQLSYDCFPFHFVIKRKYGLILIHLILSLLGVS